MARRRLPLLKNVQVSPRRCWAGLYEVTPDHHPVLGKAPGVEGFYLACGFSGHGIMHSPATGRAMAEWILHGAPRLMDCSSLGLERFAEGRLFQDTAVL